MDGRRPASGDKSYLMFSVLFLLFFVLWLKVVADQEEPAAAAVNNNHNNGINDGNKNAVVVDPATELLQRMFSYKPPEHEDHHQHRSSEDGWANKLWDLNPFRKDQRSSEKAFDKDAFNERILELKLIGARREIARRRQEQVDRTPTLLRKKDRLWPKHFAIIATKRTTPSPQLVTLAQRLSERDEGWHLVVVSLNPRQHVANYTALPATTFLSLEAQSQLPFSSARAFDGVRHDSYARKNLGYLWALLEGAKNILDAEDTLEFFPEGFAAFANIDRERWREIEDFEMYSTERRHSNKRVPGLVNHYRHFGLANFTPRGYFRSPNSRTTYRPWLSPRRDPAGVSIQVQMGLIKHHPDLSASIVNKAEFRDMSIRWNPTKDSIAVAKGTFGVLHSQPALYHKKACFTLMLPTGLPRAVVDVWRGFVAQRLLWAFDHQVGYVKTNMERDLRNVTEQELNDLDDSTVDLSNLFEPLLKTLAFMTYDEKVNTVWSVFEKTYERLHSAKLINDLDMKLARAWALDIKLLGLHESTEATASFWNFESYLDESLKEKPVIAFSHNSQQNKKFIYATQTDSTSLPPRLTEALPEDAEIIALNHANPVENMLFERGTTWREGRNLLLQEVYVAERYRGYQYDFVLMLDDDISLRCKEYSNGKFSGVEYPSKENPENVDEMRKCYQTFQDLTINIQPALMVPCSDESQTSPLIYVSPELQGAYNVFHREAIDQILPYNGMLDAESWWGSQQFVADTVFALYPNHVFWAGPVYFVNEKAREFPRGTPYFERIHEKVFADMPKYALVGGVEVSEKKRHYGDVCSCDSACDLNFCRSTEN